MLRLLSLLASLLLVVPASSLAQSAGPSQNGEDVNLPAWAQPNQTERAVPSRRAPAPLDASPQQMAPDPPTVPTPAPLGGLEWLALAGGGYALSRLRKSDADADDDGNA